MGLWASADLVQPDDVGVVARVPERRELDIALGAAWDEELEPFRHASDDAPVVWLHKVG